MKDLLKTFRIAEGEHRIAEHRHAGLAGRLRRGDGLQSLPGGDAGLHREPFGQSCERGQRRFPIELLQASLAHGVDGRPQPFVGEHIAGLDRDSDLAQDHLRLTVETVHLSQRGKAFLPPERHAGPGHRRHVPHPGMVHHLRLVRRLERLVRRPSQQTGQRQRSGQGPGRAGPEALRYRQPERGDDVQVVGLGPEQFPERVLGHRSERLDPVDGDLDAACPVGHPDLRTGTQLGAEAGPPGTAGEDIVMLYHLKEAGDVPGAERDGPLHGIMLPCPGGDRRPPSCYQTASRTCLCWS